MCNPKMIEVPVNLNTSQPNRDETLLQVKIRAKDVHNAVRNILINEMKVLPDDCVALVAKRLDERIERAVDRVIQDSWVVQGDIKNRIERKIQQLENEAKQTFLNTVAEEAKRAVAGYLSDSWISSLIAMKGK